MKNSLLLFLSPQFIVILLLISDIDECDPTLGLNQCSEKNKCLNNRGGYVCSCSDGFRLENNGRNCTGHYFIKTIFCVNILYICLDPFASIHISLASFIVGHR